MTRNFFKVKQEHLGQNFWSRHCLSDTHFLYPHYIYPHYPQMQVRPFREKNSRRGFYNTPTYQRELPISQREIFVVSSYSLSHYYTYSEEISTQTLPTHIQSVESVFGVTRKHWKKLRMADATWSLLWNSESQTRQGSKKPCWSRSLEGLGTTGRLGLEGILLTHVSQLIVQWIDYRLKGGREVFWRVLWFPL